MSYIRFLRRNLVGQDLTVLVDRIEKRMKKHDKLRWAEKTPAHVCNIGKILNAFPCARIIFMIRDPIKVAVIISIDSDIASFLC